METTHLNCPNCGHEINVNQIVYNQIKTEFAEKNILDKKAFEIRLRKEIIEETSAEIESYKEELSKKGEEIKEFNRLKAQVEIIKREKDGLKEKIEAEAEQKLTLKLNSEKQKIQKELEEKNMFKVSEKQHIIEQLRAQLTEAQRKIEQGSMQTQGEVKEIVIEEYLKKSFPFDTVEEIKKGYNGADCLLNVNTATKANVGSIYVESKNTKEFQNSWIEKFKADMRQKSATFGVIVTSTMPKGMERMGQLDGIWICSLQEFKSLCFVLRESIILLHQVAITQENKGEKTIMLYDYLTGNEFRMQVQAVVEGLSQMNNDLISEKRALESIWKKREKQIMKACLNISDIYSSVKGIAGAVIENIPALELPEPNSEPK